MSCKVRYDIVNESNCHKWAITKTFYQCSWDQGAILSIKLM